jgi:hypothetical protein
VGAALGPLGAGATFDHFGSYSLFLQLTIALMLVSSFIIGTAGERKAG